MNYKKYILLAGHMHAPEQGLHSIKASSSSYKGIIEHLNTEGTKNKWSWYQIVDRNTWKIIQEGQSWAKADH